MTSPDLEAVALVVREMGIEGRVKRHDAEYVWVRLRGEPPLSVWLEDGDTPDLVHIVHQLQEEVSETAAHWGEALPPCPGHRHPASADELDGEPWWVCPADRRAIARIGELHQPG